jgi:hypothetical protein
MVRREGEAMGPVQSETLGAVADNARRRAATSHRGFRMFAEQRGERFAGMAYAGKMPIFDAEGANLDDVARALREMIDRDLARRQASAGSKGWSSDDYVLALFRISAVLNPIQTHIIRRIGKVAGEPLTPEELRWPSGFADDAILGSLSRLAMMVSHALDDDMDIADASVPAKAIASLVEGNGLPPWTFRASFTGAARAFSEAIQ